MYDAIGSVSEKQHLFINHELYRNKFQLAQWRGKCKMDCYYETCENVPLSKWVFCLF